MKILLTIALAMLLWGCKSGGAMENPTWCYLHQGYHDGYRHGGA